MNPFNPSGRGKTGMAASLAQGIANQGVHVGHATNQGRSISSGYTQHDTMMNAFHKQSQRSVDVYNPATRKVSQAPSGGLLGSDLFGGQTPYIGY